VTPEAILALVDDLAKAGTAGLAFWQSLAEKANAQIAANLTHDSLEKPAPEPGLPKE
jgi:hypothetical protein